MSDARITSTPGVWSIACRVEVNIQARAEKIWALLTDAGGFPRWNSTVTAIDGQIRDGDRLRIHVPGTTRTFTPRVALVTPGRQMTWTGGLPLLFKGVRTFDLRVCADDSTDFSMAERFSGLMLPFVKRSLPDFGPVFERYARDLKTAAERTDH